ncbi:MAG: flippase [Candidatus Magasanikbacteria bacterium]
MSYTVAQNTSFLTIASVLQKAISFVYFTIIARLIGVENTGVYFFAIAFTSIFSVVADFGLASVLTRELAKDQGRSQSYINTILWSKIIFGLVAYALIAVAVNILNYPTILKDLVYLSGITMFFDNLHMVFYSVFRAHRNLVYEAIGLVGSQVLTLVIGTVALFGGGALYWLILAYTIPAIINAVYSGFFARRKFALRFSFYFDRAVFKLFFLMAVPFALAGIITRLYAYSDSLIMSKLLSARELGYWSVPYKITFAFQFIPMALSASIYPAFSAFFLHSPHKISDLFAKSWRYLFTIVFPLVIGIIVLAKPTIHLLYTPSYNASVPVLQILVVGLVFIFLSFVTGAFLNATNRQSIQTALMAIALAINLASNIILIPRFGIIGAAISALISNLILWLSGYIIVQKIARINSGEIIKYFLQTFIPAVVMGTVVYYLSARIYFIWTIPIGAVVYFILLFLTGGINIGLLVKKFKDIKS